MLNVLLLALEGEPDTSLVQGLEAEEVSYTLVADVAALPDGEGVGEVDALLVDLGMGNRQALAPAVAWCQALQVPLLCALPRDVLPLYDISWGATDFLVLPPSTGEVTARVRQARRRDHPEDVAAGENVLHVGDLRINLDRYEVFNRGKRVLLTFKEYKLLCTLASNPGRVFSRETLLSQIWEYDYFGGTRTVDVHVRRLRSKIEDAGQTYIETVWNVGYRFRPLDASMTGV